MPRLPHSSANSKTSLHLKLEPSRSLLRGLTVLHALAGLCAVANALPWWIKLALLPAIALSFHAVRRDYWLMPLIRGVVLEEGGTITVMRRAGPVATRLVAGAVVTPWIVILRLRTEAGQSLAVPVCRDGLDAESFRRLRVGLRCGMWKPESGE